MRVDGRVLALASCLALTATSFARTDQNSFLNRPANTLPELVKQIQTDSQVSNRFMRHFGMTKDQVVDMVSDFKLGRLPSDGVYLVYNVPSWEEVRARAIMMKKGTLVWTDQSGSPMLKVSCGNPMARGTDVGLAVATPAVKLAPAANVRDLVAMQLPETTFVDAVSSPLAPGNVVVNAAEMMPAAPILPQVGGTPFPFILPVGVGLLLGLNRGDTPPVPEPCTMVVLGLSATAMVVRRKRSKR